MKLTDKEIKRLKAPIEGQRIEWDSEIKGFGVRITAAGLISFILDYRTNYRSTTKRQRRYTIGRYPELSAEAARNGIVSNDGTVLVPGAIQLRQWILGGRDPIEERESLRDEPMFGDLLDKYLDSEEFAKRRPATQRDYRRMAEKILRPEWGRIRLKAVTRSDVEALHNSLKSTPYQANRVLQLAKRLFNYAKEKPREWVNTNPVRNIEFFHEEKRTRFLNQEDSNEMARFNQALDDYRDQNSANALRLLLLTGARSGEVLKAEWSHFNLSRGTWTKPTAHTKQKKTEHIPLSAEAVALLTSMRPANATGPLFPGRPDKNGKRRARKGLRRPWLQACKAAGLVEVDEVPSKRKGKDGKPKMLKRYRPTVRTHDLRHTYASHLASSGISLQIIGKLIGHTQASTTQRYAHLQDDSLREATNRFGKIVSIETRRSA